MIFMTDSHKVVPGPIEERIKREVPFLSNAMIIGDKLDYLTCLLTLKVLAVTILKHARLGHELLISVHRTTCMYAERCVHAVRIKTRPFPLACVKNINMYLFLSSNNISVWDWPREWWTTRYSSPWSQGNGGLLRIYLYHCFRNNKSIGQGNLWCHHKGAGKGQFGIYWETT